MSELDYFNTERLLAERLQEGHLEFIHQMHQNERVMKYLGGKRTPEQTADYMKLNLSHWKKYGYGIWVIRENASEDFIGRGGLRNTVFDGKDEVEVAYGFLPEFWNKGLATEFTKEVMRIGFSEIGLSNLVSITHHNNMASHAVLKKVGFEFEQEIIYKAKPYLLFRHDNFQ